MVECDAASVPPNTSGHASGLVYPPQTDAKDAWAPLLWTGPNGFVMIVTLLFWWGMSLKTRTHWQDDSSLLWKEVVNDVVQTLQSLKEVLGTFSKKRKAAGIGHTGQKKWLVVL